jgi:hypothetical protein
LEFATLDELQAAKVFSSGEVAVTAYLCPPNLARKFPDAPFTNPYCETFLPGVQGTTWFEKDYFSGSVNRGDFWIQRRPLLAYWSPSHSAHFLFMEDDYDFTYVLLYSTQERNSILGLVNCRSRGEGKHNSIDMLKNGHLEALSLRLQLDVSHPAAERPSAWSASLRRCLLYSSEGYTKKTHTSERELIAQ